MVGIICALSIELSAVKGMFDAFHNAPVQTSSDQSPYAFGRIGAHNVVAACLPAGDAGIVSAARAAILMTSSFASMKFGLLVGIGGGIPDENSDIRLGDVVVSMPTGECGGVRQYDVGKRLEGGGFEATGSLNRPPEVLLRALSHFNADNIYDRGQNLSKHVESISKKYPGMEDTFSRPKKDDHLYEATYVHVGKEKTCSECAATELVERKSRPCDYPVIHCGLIATGNQVIKDAAIRDQFGKIHKVLCFETEAAGLMNAFPCLVIRGISDYADSHKNDDWQSYAAAAAAAFAKELLLYIPGAEVDSAPSALDTIVDTGEPNFFCTYLQCGRLYEKTSAIQV
jgi:nucleoside phosphorylase